MHFRPFLFNVLTVLHLSLGIEWFRKAEAASDLLSATRAQVLFEHVYTSYQDIHVHHSAQTQAPVVSARPSTSGSFLDNICMANVVRVEVALVSSKYL
jgi:hypothetical protein